MNGPQVSFTDRQVLALMKTNSLFVTETTSASALNCIITLLYYEELLCKRCRLELILKAELASMAFKCVVF